MLFKKTRAGLEADISFYRSEITVEIFNMIDKRGLITCAKRRVSKLNFPHILFDTLRPVLEHQGPSNRVHSSSALVATST